MGIAILLFGLVVGIFHFQSQEPDPGVHQSLAAAPVEPGNYREPGGAKKQPTVVLAMVAGSDTGSTSQGDM